MPKAPRPPRPPGPPPVRLEAEGAGGPFAPGRSTVLARVAGDGLRALDVRDGDLVVLVQRERAEHGDLAAVLDPRGRVFLWKVYPEGTDDGGERLRLAMGPPSLDRHAEPGSRVHGIVVAVLRRERATSLEAQVPHDD